MISARFEAQVAANPDRLAIWADDQTLSYQQLNEASNRVARSLLAASGGTGTVAVLLGQGALPVVAMLGVLKAGMVFVPLDPRQPRARLRQILEDCKARLLLTDECGLTAAPAALRPRVRLFNIDRVDVTLPSTNLGLSIGGKTTACLMYTSGSTGSPKGVVQTHNTLLHRTDAYTDLLQLEEQDRLTLLAHCSVAQGLSSTLQALLNGASLHPFDLRARGVGELAPWLIAHGITVFVSTVSTFRHFAKTLTTENEFSAVKAIRLGSEPVFPDDLRLFRRHFSRRCRLVTTLGSTEAGPIAAHVIDHGSVINHGVPAGYPIAGVTVTILDDTGQPCPPQQTGEIAVQSRFVFSGYWDDLDRTAASLVQVANSDGDRLYLTGDLGALRSDGGIEFRGRKNLRVKVRGFRVELEEIERALSSCPLVAEAAVIARPDSSGDSRLAAFIVPGQGQRPSTDQLQTHLQSILPDYMVPPSFEFLSTLPRTATGKVDRTALPPQRTDPSSMLADREPADVIELCLKNLWEDLLNQRPVSVAANFFELGGDSLLAARLSVAIERTFGAKLPMATFLTSATIQQQAHRLREVRTHSPWPSLVPIRTSGSKPPLFCVHLLDGNILSYRDLIRSLPADQPVYGLQSRGLDGMGLLNTRIEDMARDYAAEVQKVLPRGPFAICGWSFGGVVAFELARRFEQSGRSVALLALLDSRATASIASVGRVVRRVPHHLHSLLHGHDRLAYIGHRIQTVRRRITNALWRRMVTWYRFAGWLPAPLRSVTHSNRCARREYVPHPYGGHVALFRATRNRKPPISDSLGWTSLVADPLDTHDVPGTHLTMVFEPHARILGAKLTRCLEEAWARTAVPNRTADDDDEAA